MFDIEIRRKKPKPILARRYEPPRQDDNETYWRKATPHLIPSFRHNERNEVVPFNLKEECERFQAAQIKRVEPSPFPVALCFAGLFLCLVGVFIGIIGIMCCLPLVCILWPWLFPKN